MRDSKNARPSGSGNEINSGTRQQKRKRREEGAEAGAGPSKRTRSQLDLTNKSLEELSAPSSTKRKREGEPGAEDRSSQRTRSQLDLTNKSLEELSAPSSTKRKREGEPGAKDRSSQHTGGQQDLTESLPELELPAPSPTKRRRITRTGEATAALSKVLDDANEILEDGGALTNRRDIMAVVSSMSSKALGTGSTSTDKGKGKEPLAEEPRSASEGAGSDDKQVNVSSLEQLRSAVKDVTQLRTQLGNFFKSYQKYFTKESNDWKELIERRDQLKTSHAAAQQALASGEPNTANLQEKYNELIQSQRAMDDAFLPFGLRVAVMDTQRQFAWAQDRLESHRAFFTEGEGSGNGTDVCQQVSESLQQLNDHIAAAKTMLTSEARNADRLRDACEQLDQSRIALNKALLPFRLRDTIVNMQGQFAWAQDRLESHRAFFTEGEGSGNGTDVCQQVDKSLQDLNRYIDEAKKTLTSETRPPEHLRNACEQLDQSRIALDEVMLPLRLRDTIINTENWRAWAQKVFDFHQAFFTGKEGPRNGADVCTQVDKSLQDLNRYIDEAKKILTSDTSTSKNLRNACEQLNQSQTALDKALLPLKLRNIIINTEEQCAQAQDFLDSHQEFLTELKRSESGAEVYRHIDESLKQLKTDINEARTRLASETGAPENLSEASESLDKNSTLFDKTMLPLKLRVAVKTGQEQCVLTSILKKGSGDRIEDHQRLEDSLQQLQESITIAEQSFIDMSADAKKLGEMLDQLSSNQENVKNALPQIDLQTAIERCALLGIDHIKSSASDWIGDHIASIQEKVQDLSPIQEILPVLMTTTLEPIRDGAFKPLAQEFVAGLEEITQTLNQASAFLLGKHIYDSAEECLRDNGEKVREVLSTIEKDLLPLLRSRLGQTFSDENLSLLQKQLNHILENTTTYLPSELSDQNSITIEALHNVRQYWQSHKEEIAKQFPRDQHNIKFTLYAIGNKYSEESADLSILSQVATRSDDSHAQIMGRIEMSPQAMEAVSQIEQFNEQDNDYRSLLQIQTQFLEHEKEKLPEFLSRATRFSADWQSHQAEMDKVFGAGTYEEGKKILALITTEITAEKYTPENMSLELANSISDHNKNIRDLEIKLAYMALRKEIAWLERPEDSENDREQLIGVSTELHQTFLDSMNFARSLDTWVSSKDPRMTPDVIEKIGQLLTKADRLHTLALTSADAGTGQRSKVSREEIDNLAQQLSSWDSYRRGQEPQPPIYPKDILPRDRVKFPSLYTTLNNIDPSKVEIMAEDPGEPCTPEEVTEMRKDARRQFEALQKEMKKKLAPTLDQIPAFKGFPVEALWRLCISHKYQREDATSSIDAMTSHYQDKPEPYFLVKIMRGLHITLAGLGKKLTPEYYQLLHDECMKDTVIVKSGRKFLGETGFRDLKVWKNNDGPFFPTTHVRLSHFTPARLDEVGQMYDARDPKDPRYIEDPRYKEEGHPVGRILAWDPRERIGENIGLPYTEEECKAHAQCIFNKYYEEIDQTRSRIMIRHDQQEWSWDFAKNLSKEEIEEVLTPIVHCCRDLEISHLFGDGNGRVHGFCILNKLLLENNLPPAIMKPNPYAFNCYGVKEIIPHIREGQAIFESYKQPQMMRRPRN